MSKEPDHCRPWCGAGFPGHEGWSHTGSGLPDLILHGVQRSGTLGQPCNEAKPCGWHLPPKGGTLWVSRLWDGTPDAAASHIPEWVTMSSFEWGPDGQRVLQLVQAAAQQLSPEETAASWGGPPTVEKVSLEPTAS